MVENGNGKYDRSNRVQTELPSPEFISAIRTGIAIARGLIHERFEIQPITNTNRLIYHTLPHTDGVISRTGNILRTIRAGTPELVSERDILLGEFMAAWHDVVQKSVQVDLSTGKRKRDIGNNERSSADEAINYMKKVNKESGQSIFTDTDMQKVDGIMITVPDWNQRLGTVFQKTFSYYAKEGNVPALALGIADLGGPMEGFGTTLWEAFAVFFEEQAVDLVPNILSNTPTNVEGTYNNSKNRIIGWLNNQTIFLSGRKELLGADIALMISPLKDVLMNILLTEFQYDARISQLEEYITNIQGETPTQLMSRARAVLSNPPTYNLPILAA